PRDDFRRLSAFQRDPPWGAARDRGDQRQIALGSGHRFDRGRRTEMRNVGDGETEVEARRIAHCRLTEGNIGVHRERRLYVSEGRYDHAPDALDSVERQNTAMTLYQPPHNIGLARRAKSRTDLLGLFHLNQPVD